MRRLVVAFLVAVLAFTLVGCGGGDEAEPADTAATEEPVAVVAAPVVEEEPADTLSPLEDQDFVLFPNRPEVTPTSISSRIDAGIPMIVFLNDGAQSSTFDQLDIIEDVLDEYNYRGMVDLVGFDIGKYVTTETSDTITIEPEFSDDPIAKQAIGLVKELGVGFTPYIVIVDEYGYITWRNQGLVDGDTLRAQIMRATSDH